MGKGGARIGAGRKPDPNSVRSRRKARQLATVLQHPSAPPRQDTAQPTDAIDEFDAPNDLTLEQRQVWVEFATLAFKNGRLTRQTAAAFKAYCGWVAIERACAQSVTDKGSVTHDRAMKWVARFYAEFSLTPGGRAVGDGQPAPKQDEDEAFFGGSGVSGR